MNQREDTMQRPPKLGHVDESHQIFDRVTTLEATVGSLHESVKGLTAAVGETNATMAEIKSLVSSVGKTDGKTIVTTGVSVIGAMVVVASLFLGPVQRDMAHATETITKLAERYEEHLKEHGAAVMRAAELAGDMKLVDWRLKALEEKR